jgi:hypothetical protein
MSYFDSSSAFDHHESTCELSAFRNNDRRPNASHVADRAIDSALRSVPLPAGLMTRLGKLVYEMPDETTDQVDCLGC